MNLSPQIISPGCWGADEGAPDPTARAVDLSGLTRCPLQPHFQITALTRWAGGPGSDTL